MKFTSHKTKNANPNKKTQHNEEQKNNSSKGKDKVITPCFASSFDLFINVTKQREQGKVFPRNSKCSWYLKKKTNAEKRSHFPFYKLLIKLLNKKFRNKRRTFSVGWTACHLREKIGKHCFWRFKVQVVCRLRTSLCAAVYYFLFLLGGENTVKLASREQAPCGMRACWDYITVCSLNSCNISGDQNFKAERNDFRRVEGSSFR